MSSDLKVAASAMDFDKDIADGYDERFSKLSEIADNLHLLIRLILDDVPSDARILCVGVGTGAEILSLGEINPGWTFVGVDPSADMLNVCRRKLEKADLLSRCELIHGRIENVPQPARFDAVLSILVAHFMPPQERDRFYQSTYRLLKDRGYFVTAEISGDFDAPEYLSMLANWKTLHKFAGASDESLQDLPEVLRNTLYLKSPNDTKALIKKAGYNTPVPFFQSFLIRGMFARK